MKNKIINNMTPIDKIIPDYKYIQYITHRIKLEIELEDNNNIIDRFWKLWTLNYFSSNITVDKHDFETAKYDFHNNIN